MLFGLFENYTTTSDPSSKRKKFPALESRKSSDVCFDILKKKIEKDNFLDIVANEEFHDIYGEKYGYEVSIQIAQNGFGSIIGLSVYGEHRRGRTRKFFKRYYEEIKQLI